MPEIAVGVQLHHLHCSFIHLLDCSFDKMVFLTFKVNPAMTKARCWRTW